MSKGNTYSEGWWFAQVPIWAISDQGLSDGALRLLGYLKYRQGTDAACWPSKATIAEDLHISMDTVTRRIRELDATGYVERIIRPGHSNLYHLIADPNDGSERWKAHEAQRKAKRMEGLKTDPPAELPQGETDPPAELPQAPPAELPAHDERKDDKKEQDSAHAESSPRSEELPSSKQTESSDELAKHGLTGEAWHAKHGNGNGNLSPPRGDEPWLRWGDGQVKPRPGISARDLQHVGWLVEKVFDLVPVGKEWRSWTSAFAQMYEVAEGDFDLIERGVTLAWEREAKYRPTHPNGFIKAIRKAAMNTDAPDDSSVWTLDQWEAYEEQKREREA